MQQHGKNNILFLTGLMGCGKSTIAPLLADRLAYDWIDTDAEIVRKTGLSIPDLFEERGEAAFRREEQAVIQDITARGQLVVALGGGALIHAENRALISENGILVFLNVPPAVLADRIADDDSRPLLAGCSGVDRKRILEALLRSRREQYETADLILTPEDDSPEDVCDLILICLGAQV